MASNPTPDNPDILRALCTRMAKGCKMHEVPLGIKQNTEAVMLAAHGGLSAAETALGLRKKEVAAAYDALQAADNAGFSMLTDCKLRIAKLYGQRWNVNWEPTGFPNQSTGIPDDQPTRLTLLDALKNYFTAKPADESVDMGATAALCLAQHTAITDAQAAVDHAESEQTKAFATRATAEDALRKRVRGLIEELTIVLPADDARWEDFGLSIPANPRAPESVASVTASTLSNSRLDVSWPYATRATRYRVETFIVGVDTEWQNKASAKDLEVILKGFTVGQVVKIRIIAFNDGGDAPPSPEMQITVT
ncbi:MAG: fibronectin type III domain-containing protein [Prosthecobacter sp.]|uniref:fibronectin type III domain-containing protein n=1 Tax=Prosthecobacter sp. TaxID=1965333 RepID=UPI0038FEDDAA